MNSNSLILVTGASGFVGSHILRAFLTAGYQVRAAVRGEASSRKILHAHPGYLSQISFVYVPDITVPHAFDRAVLDVNGVVHAASPFVTTVDDNERDLLQPAIEGTLEILRSVSAHAPNVKRVVITSSFAAANDFSQGLRPGYIYTEKHWNPISFQAAKSGNGGLAYGGSKKLAEAAAWSYMADGGKTHFTLATILPPMVYGPLLDEDEATLEHLNTSSADIWRLMNGTLTTTPSTPMPAFVDVRDVGLAHVRAFEETGDGGRYLVCAGEFTYKQVCNILREEFPDSVPHMPLTNENDESGHYIINNTKAVSALGITFRDLRTCNVDMARRLQEIATVNSL